MLIWTQETPTSPWKSRPLSPPDAPAFTDVVWRVSWSTSGSILAVSSGDNKVTLWKEGLEGGFEMVGDYAQ